MTDKLRPYQSVAAAAMLSEIIEDGLADWFGIDFNIRSSFLDEKDADGRHFYRFDFEGNIKALDEILWKLSKQEDDH